MLLARRGARAAVSLELDRNTLNCAEIESRFPRSVQRHRIARSLGVAETMTTATKVPGYTDGREMRETPLVDAPFLEELLALWNARRGERSLPARRDFDAVELMRFGGRIALIDVEHEPKRYRFRLIGSRMTEVLGRDSTGRYVDELYDDDFYQTAVGPYERVLRDRRPVTSHGNMKRMGKEFLRFHSLDLPLSSDGERVDMIMKGTEFGALEDRPIKA
jgi:hypothetical protein